MLKWEIYDIRNLTAEEYERYYAMMTGEKQRRVDRFRFPDDRKRTVAAELLVRRAIAAACRVSEAAIVFDTQPRGKPFARDLAIEFSAGHSGNLAVCAVSERPVGIDVERIRPINLVVAKRVCTPAELESLFGRPPRKADFSDTDNPELLRRFYAFWTQKEAYGKYTGLGVFESGFTRPENGFATFFQELDRDQDKYCISIYNA